MDENILELSEPENAARADGYIERKQMYVKRQFQHSMLLQSILATFIIVNAIVMLVFWAMDTAVDLLQLKFYLAIAIAVFEVVGFIVLYKMNLTASHRIAGPIFSMERFFENVEDGNLTATLKLRQSDQFPETAEQLNATVNSLRKRINNAQYLAEQLQQHPEDTGQLAKQLVDELAHFNTTNFDQASPK